MTAIEEIRGHAERAKREGGMYYSGEYLDGLALRVEAEYKTVVYENANLRELVADLYAQLLNAYDPKELDEFYDRMRELGVEVDGGRFPLIDENQEIVRCRYCENSSHFHKWSSHTRRAMFETWTCRNMADGVEVEPDGFCAWGKRRADNE